MVEPERLFKESLNPHLSETQRWIIAYSGGLDSTVLLHLASRFLPSEQLHVLHIDHQLQSCSAAWAEFCRAQVLALGLSFQCVKVSVADGASPEQAAREARYHAFEQFLQQGDCLLLAQHRDDQAETMLFRLLRGAGVKGLAGMPEGRALGAGQLFRPLLKLGRQQLQQWAESENLSWIEDESNRDLAFDRNYLRHEIMPLLEKRWPGFPHRWSETAGHLREADQLLSELAQSDLSSLTDDLNGIECSRLLQLSEPRQKNVLRYWLQAAGGNAGEKLLRSLGQLINAQEDADPKIDLKGVSIRRFRGRIYQVVRGEEICWQNQQLNVAGINLPGGRLRVTTIASGGLKSLESIQLRNRQEGDRCSPVGRGGSTQLKKLFQEHNIPTWLRSSWPVCTVGDEIVAVPGICVCEGWQSEKNIPGFQLKWLPTALSDDSDSGTL